MVWLVHPVSNSVPAEAGACRPCAGGALAPCAPDHLDRPDDLRGSRARQPAALTIIHSQTKTSGEAIASAVGVRRAHMRQRQAGRNRIESKPGSIGAPEVQAMEFKNPILRD
ncbi:hypothetical protein [Burkholderia glumae]|uniref:hypothetical protein n=1 Tax=Burkholderia glumae TaxID=337 RepID=UPI001373D610|nr:hypothetical protein [Burkholderia glumae]MCR1768283.1 hypothetical protein [Burkholderia glumae]QHP93537.1 hypothetical protein EXE55_21830 [Burkholderia glumae]QJP69798.1 hypothetical protein HJC54_05435 [Burkholderia glumae]